MLKNISDNSLVLVYDNISHFIEAGKTIDFSSLTEGLSDEEKAGLENHFLNKFPKELIEVSEAIETTSEVSEVIEAISEISLSPAETEVKKRGRGRPRKEEK